MGIIYISTCKMQKSKEERLQELIDNFEKNCPDDASKMGDYYDTIDPELYDEFIEAINFTTEPKAVSVALEEIVKPADDQKIFDVGCGTGLLGKLLGNKQYKNIVG